MENLSTPGDLARASVAIARRDLRCVEVVEAHLARATATEPLVRAFLHIDATGALREAKERDRELAQGQPRSALHGIPVGIKDIIDVAGMPTTAGSRVVTPNIPDEDAEIVAALRAAGAIIIGKTNTHEFANGAVTPPTRNPVDTLRIAGGSSGGSAAAIAARSVLLAVGTDTGGSVRLPAALCGVAGFRPSHREISIGMGGIMPLAAEFDQWGLLAPGAADLVAAYSALSYSAPAQAGVDEFRFVVPEGLRSLLQGLEAGVLQCFDAAMGRLATAGARVTTVAMPSFAEWRAPRMMIQMQQMLEVHRRAGWWPRERDRYTDEVRSNLEFAEQQVAVSLDDFRTKLRELDAAVDLVLARGSLLALPTVAITSPKVSDVEQMPRGLEARHPIIGLLGQAVLPFSRHDLASITIPCGTAGGLPVGLQLVGTHNTSVLSAAVCTEPVISAESTKTVSSE